MSTFISDLSGKEFPISERVSGKIVRKSIMDLIRKDNPKFTSDNYLALSEINSYHEKYFEQVLVSQTGELTESEQSVLDALKVSATIADKLNDDSSANSTFGQKIADKVAAFGGSWTFIIIFGIFLAMWICLNLYWMANKGFDPYPFILLNLILSTLAAMQAPVIMMSQNRQEEKDRDRSKNDYMVNLKSELEIRMLHEKLDHLIINQQQEVLEMQKQQMEMLKDIISRLVNKKDG